MLTAKTQAQGDALQVTLSGIIDELTDFDHLIGEGFKEVRVVCRDISRINSLGAKIWRTFFHKLRCNFVKVRFIDASPAIVNQINYISDFVEVSEIQSICIPYYCSACSTTDLVSHGIEEVKKMITSEVPASKCPKCAQATYFDEIPDEYFSFLMD